MGLEVHDDTETSDNTCYVFLMVPRDSQQTYAFPTQPFGDTEKMWE